MMTEIQTPKAYRVLNLPDSSLLYPTKKFIELWNDGKIDHCFGNIYERKKSDGIWYEFSIWNQVKLLSGHYSIKYKPDTGEVLYKKFADYGSLTYYYEVEENWRSPENETLATYLRILCKHSWMHLYHFTIVSYWYNEENILRWRRAPVNVHTGEAYKDNYFNYCPEEN